MLFGLVQHEVSRYGPTRLLVQYTPFTNRSGDMLTKFCRRMLRPALLGTLRRTTPLSSQWGYDRGTPIDRHYIECFLQEHKNDIRGRVLEMKDSGYTLRFGSRLESQDVLDIDATNPNATIIADLSAMDNVPSGSFDCFILTETLQYIYDSQAAVKHAHRLLADNGVLLISVPGISRLTTEIPSLADYWRFTPASCACLFGEVFGAENVEVRACGNVLTSIASLSGMAREELSLAELEAADPRFPVVILVRAVRRM